MLMSMHPKGVVAARKFTQGSRQRVRAQAHAIRPKIVDKACGRYLAIGQDEIRQLQRTGWCIGGMLAQV